MLELEGIKMVPASQVDRLKERIKKLELNLKEEKERKVLMIKKNMNNKKTNFPQKWVSTETLKKEVDQAQELNRNLLRICRQRANKDKNLLSRNSHHGYILVFAQEYNYKLRFPNKETKKIKCWQMRLQTPHDLLMDPRVVKSLIEKELRGILGIENIVNITTLVDDKKVNKLKDLFNQEDNFIFKTSLRSNLPGKFWEVDLLVKDLVTIPANMLIVNHSKKKKTKK